MNKYWLTCKLDSFSMIDSVLYLPLVFRLRLEQFWPRMLSARCLNQKYLRLVLCNMYSNRMVIIYCITKCTITGYFLPFFFPPKKRGEKKQRLNQHYRFQTTFFQDPIDIHQQDMFQQWNILNLIIYLFFRKKILFYSTASYSLNPQPR